MGKNEEKQKIHENHRKMSNIQAEEFPNILKLNGLATWTFYAAIPYFYILQKNSQKLKKDSSSLSTS